MFLLAFVLLNLNLELLDLLLMVSLPAAKFSNIVKIQLLALDTAHLFPNAERLVGHLLVDRRSTPCQELLRQLVLLHEKSP